MVQTEPLSDSDAEVTAPHRVVTPPQGVPLLLADFMGRGAGLTPLELEVGGWADGLRTVEDIAAAVNLGIAEVETILASLLHRNLIEVRLPKRLTDQQSQRCQEILDLAEAAEHNGDFQRAVDVLRMGVACIREGVELYNRLAVILAGRYKQFLEAELLLRQALKIDPGYRDTSRNLECVLEMASPL